MASSAWLAADLAAWKIIMKPPRRLTMARHCKRERSLLVRRRSLAIKAPLPVFDVLEDAGPGTARSALTPSLCCTASGPAAANRAGSGLQLVACFAAAAWLISSALLSWYLASFANYNATYGSLGAGIGMMMWMWVTSIVILFGAELNSEIEHQTAHDSTVGGDKPLGARGAVMADTVGKAQ
jgi:Virulence factor BrkB